MYILPSVLSIYHHSQSFSLTAAYKLHMSHFFTRTALGSLEGVQRLQCTIYTRIGPSHMHIIYTANQFTAPPTHTLQHNNANLLRNDIT